jgi:hypothetical protein
MKKAILTTSAFCCVILLLVGADFLPAKEAKAIPRKHCSGYKIIEAGKGIDCYGDTVKLVRTHGFYELASQYQK